jgi:hypothetical protein
LRGKFNGKEDGNDHSGNANTSHDENSCANHTPSSTESCLSAPPPYASGTHPPVSLSHPLPLPLRSLHFLLPIGYSLFPALTHPLLPVFAPPPYPFVKL